jgi:glycosyltransferase involved in cell wall biosynthesis
MTDVRFAIVIPIHNEAGFLTPAVAALHAELAPVTSAYRVILSENGSTDETLQRADAIAAVDQRVSVLAMDDPDYGGAMRAGMETVTDAEWIVTFDIDYFSGAFVGRLIDVAADADVVIASKRAPGSEDRRSMVRRLGTAVFNWLLRTLVGSKVSDTHGIKAFRTSVVAELLPEVVLRQDLFDTELVIRAERAGKRITELPVVVEERRAARSSLLKRIPRTLRGIFTLRSTLRSS